MVGSLLFFGVVRARVISLGFILGFSRFLNCLIVLENLNVVLLFICLWGQTEDSRVLFMILMVIFTVEVTLGLVVLSRLWRLSELGSVTGV